MADTWSAGAIIGIVVIVLFVLVLIILLLVWLFRREEGRILADIPVKIQSLNTGDYMVVDKTTATVATSSGIVKTNGSSSDPSSTWVLKIDPTNKYYTLMNNDGTLANKYISWVIPTQQNITPTVEMLLSSPGSISSPGWFSLESAVVTGTESFTTQFLAVNPRGFFIGLENQDFELKVNDVSSISETFIITMA